MLVKPRRSKWMFKKQSRVVNCGGKGGKPGPCKVVTRSVEDFYAKLPDEAFWGTAVDIPISLLTMTKKQIDGAKKDIKEGRKSHSPKHPVEAFYNEDMKRFIVTDGVHRIVEAHARGEKTIRATFEAGNNQTKSVYDLKPKQPFTLNTDYSSTQLEITDLLAIQRIRFLQEKLDPADVVELETEPHITVKYGLLTQDPKQVEELVTKYGPIWVSLGNLSLFESEEQDVLKMSVRSLGLENLNRLVGLLPNEDSYKVYNPHMTIAYLNPGTGVKYIQDPSFLEWYDFVFTKLTFSDKERVHTELALNCGGKGGKPGPCPTKRPELKLGDSFPVDDNYHAKVVSVDKEEPGLSYEKATSLSYIETKTGKVAGVIQIIKDKDSWIVGAHYIDKEHRGKGLGRKLIPKLADKLGAISSDSDAHTPDAARLWEAIPGVTRKGNSHVLQGKIVTNTEKRPTNTLGIDPTRTLTLRKAFATEMTKRFERLKGKVIQLIDVEDAFGLKPKNRDSLFTTNVFCPTGEGGGVDPTCRVTERAQVARDLRSLMPDWTKIRGTAKERMDVEQAIMDYMQEGFSTIQDDLRRPGDPIQWAMGKNQRQIRRMNQAFEQAGHTLKSPMIAYRVVSKSVVSKDGDYTDRGFLSTTADLGIAKDILLQMGGDAGLFKVILPKGTVVMAPIGTAGAKEVLVMRGSTVSYEELNQSATIQNVRWKFNTMAEKVEEDAFGLSPKNQGLFAANVFCPTGEGGGVDPSCSVTKRNAVSKDNAVETFERISQSVFSSYGTELKEDMRVAHLPNKRFVQAQLKIDYFKPVPKVRIDFGVIGQSTQYVGKDVEDGTQQLMTLVKSAVKKYHTAGFDIEVAAADEQRRRVYAKALKKMGLEMKWEGTGPSGFQVWNEQVQNTRWKFNTMVEKVEAFKKWLRQYLVKDIISEAHKTDDDWWTKYVEWGFKKGQGRTFDDVKKKGTIPQEKMSWYDGTKEQFLKSAFANPVAVEKVKLLAGRVYTDLVGVTDAMATTMARTLTDGLVQGKSPREVARDLNKNIEQIGKNRAVIIARTETIRAHAEGQLSAMEDLGISQVTAAVEWSTAGDARVCPLCRPLEGLVLKLSEARNMLPRHPQCRCAWLPANVGEDKTGQKRSLSQIGSAISKSLKKEFGTKKPKPWFGKKSFAKARPKNITNLLARIDNVFCPTGKGGGTDPTCSPGKDIPKIPYFKSSNKQAVEANITASKEMRTLAQVGAIDALKNHPGTPSPKVQEYKKQLLQSIQSPALKDVPQKKQLIGKGGIVKGLIVKQTKSTIASIEDKIGSGQTPNLDKAIDHVVAKTGYTKDQLKTGLGHDLTMRAKVTDAILSGEVSNPNAVHGVALGDEAKVKSLTQGDTAGPLKEFSDTPKYDIAVLSSIKVSKEPLPGEALASLDVGYIKVGSTTRPGSYRHELGHVIHGTYTHRAKGVVVDKAVEQEFAKVQEKVKANPIGLKTKQEHAWYEKEYGVVGRRCLDNSKENFAEQYRVYHREIFRDKNEGGGGKFLEGYRTRHPGWAKIWDAHYTTALIHEHLNKG